jgi:hypothetical protein
MNTNCEVPLHDDIVSDLLCGHVSVTGNGEYEELLDPWLFVLLFNPEDGVSELLRSVGMVLSQRTALLDATAPAFAS